MVFYFHQFEIEPAEQIVISKDVNEGQDRTSLERFGDIHAAKGEIQVSCLCLYNYSSGMLIEF